VAIGGKFTPFVGVKQGGQTAPNVSSSKRSSAWLELAGIQLPAIAGRLTPREVGTPVVTGVHELVKAHGVPCQPKLARTAILWTIGIHGNNSPSY